MAESAPVRGVSPAPASSRGPGWAPPSQPGEQAAGRFAVREDPLAPGPAAERCWLCGARLPVQALMADGGTACTDVRWYCRNTRVCTERWTGQRTKQRAAAGPGSPV